MDNDFRDLLKIFEQGFDTEISLPLAKMFFDFTPNPDPNFGNKTLLVKEIVFQNDNFIGLSAYSDCGAGGICQHTDLILFTHNGKPVDKLIGFEIDVADCSFADLKYCSYYSDSLLIVVNQQTKGDCIKDTLFSNMIQIEYIRISKYGRISKGMTQHIDTRRKYYTLSSDLLFPKDLANKTKQDMAIMRNEIYAAHGYRFKTDKWADYFKRKLWYEPQYDNVEDQLSEIERKNIELILEFEQK